MPLCLSYVDSYPWVVVGGHSYMEVKRKAPLACGIGELSQQHRYGEKHVTMLLTRCLCISFVKVKVLARTICPARALPGLIVLLSMYGLPGCRKLIVQAAIGLLNGSTSNPFRSTNIAPAVVPRAFGEG